MSWLASSAQGKRKVSKPVEEAIEASIVVLAVFAWIAAMTLLP